jgi:peptidylprolyl isomerase
MTFENGTLVLTNYTAKIKDTQTPIGTTMEDEAKKLGVYDPSRRYEPMLVAVGEGWVLKGVDEAIGKADVGKRITVEIPPEKAYGTRDPNQVKLIPIRKFGEKADQLEVGSEVEVDNRVGIVRFIGSGRAQVDFNHRYAGKTIEYDLEVVKSLGNQDEKVKALVRRRLPIEEANLSYELADSKLTIKLPSEVYLLEGLQILKRATASDIFKYAKGPSVVEFLESYEAPKPPTPPSQPEGKEETEKKGEEEKEKPTVLGAKTPGEEMERPESLQPLVVEKRKRKSSRGSRGKAKRP